MTLFIFVKTKKSDVIISLAPELLSAAGSPCHHRVHCVVLNRIRLSSLSFLGVERNGERERWIGVIGRIHSTLPSGKY